MPSDPVITGRCYCGACRISATSPPQVVTYCHCADCRRSSGSAVACFAAFDEAAVTLTGPAVPSAGAAAGVERLFCRACGTPIAARYAYLPRQVYVSHGCLDQAAAYPPDMHAHFDERLPWVVAEDGLPKSTGSGRAALSPGGD
ncbi:MAG: GFA family protein [Pseudomonadota bacterium]